MLILNKKSIQATIDIFLTTTLINFSVPILKSTETLILDLFGPWKYLEIHNKTPLKVRYVSKFGVATLKFLKIIGFFAQFCTQLLFLPKKVYFKGNLNIFLHFMLFNFLVQMLKSTETLFFYFIFCSWKYDKTSLKVVYFSKLKKTVKYIFSNVAYRPAV